MKVFFNAGQAMDCRRKPRSWYTPSQPLRVVLNSKGHSNIQTVFPSWDSIQESKTITTGVDWITGYFCPETPGPSTSIGHKLPCGKSPPLCVVRTPSQQNRSIRQDLSANMRDLRSMNLLHFFLAGLELRKSRHHCLASPT